MSYLLFYFASFFQLLINTEGKKKEKLEPIHAAARKNDAKAVALILQVRKRDNNNNNNKNNNNNNNNTNNKNNNNNNNNNNFAMI